MYEELVEKRQWIEKDTFLNALSHCMILPGPEATHLAIFLGHKLHGVRGGLFAGVLFVLPSMFIILGFSLLYVQFGRLPSRSVCPGEMIFSARSETDGTDKAQTAERSRTTLQPFYSW
jgi:chromate transport protein ChrA